MSMWAYFSALIYQKRHKKHAFHLKGETMKNIEKEEVTLSQLLSRCNERLPLYDNRAIKEIIMVFMEELRDAMIKNYCVSLRGYFIFRHKRKNARIFSNFGNPVEYPERMTIKTTFSKDRVLNPLNKYYEKTGKKKPGSLNDIPLKDFK